MVLVLKSAVSANLKAKTYSLLTKASPEIRIASSGIAWKGDDSGTIATLSAGDIKWAQWTRVARNFQLRLGLKDRTRTTFDGFVREVRR